MCKSTLLIDAAGVPCAKQSEMMMTSRLILSITGYNQFFHALYFVSLEHTTHLKPY